MEMPLYTAQKRTTAGNIAFLLLSFPLGLFYFLLTVIGLTVGVSMLVIWIGLPVLFATFMVVRGMAEIERRMATSLLHVSFPAHLQRYDAPQQGFLRRFGRVLRDPLTWTSTLYMILKFPLGIISFTLALVLPIVTMTVSALPVVYLVNLFVNLILLKNGIHSTGIIIPYFIEVHAEFDLVMFARSFIGILVGPVLWFMTRYLLDGLALLSGEMARALLSPGGVDVTVQPGRLYAAAMSQEALHVSAAPGKNE